MPFEEQAYAWGKNRQLHFALGRAAVTGPGPTESSGGVAVGVTPHLASKGLVLPEVLLPYAHRLAIRHVNVDFPMGLLVASVYLAVKEGPKGPTN